MMIEVNKDGTILASVRNADRTAAWTEELMPGEWERAEALLSTEDMEVVRGAWTDKVVARWRAANPDYVPPRLPEGVSTQREIAELRAALHELATTGTLAPERLQKLQARVEDDSVKVQRR